MVKIAGCTCEHEVQDELYGVGRRLHNAGKAPAGLVAWICTVCGNRFVVSEKKGV
jgi:hypothetical protein